MSSFTLANPWLLALLPVPLLVLWIAPAYSQPRRGLVVPYLARLAGVVGRQPARGATVSRASAMRWIMLAFCWTCVVLALARPQVIEPPVERSVPVRDLLLAVDLSGSMDTRDFQNADGQTVDRLTAVKGVLDDFLARRQGDRVGLIFFGSAAFVQAPFTEDLDVCRELLDEAQVRMAGPQTAFGDALGLAINVFDRSTVEERVLIALTDGNDTTSQVPPGKAAQIARDKGIVIHTVAVGDPTAAGEDALDEVTLKQVASATGGLYSHAGSRQELEAIYDQLDTLETRKVQTVSHRPRRDVYWWPLAAALVASMAYFTIGLALGHRHRGVPRATLTALAPAALAAAAPAGLAESSFTLHIVRAEWLLALVPAALLWWLLRRRSDPTQGWRRFVAPHLLGHLWSGRERSGRFDPLTLVAVLWLLAIIAIAGPAWRHVPSPFADDTAALAIVVAVSPSMQTEDVAPSRLERATLKIHDLLQARGNAKTALIAYQGSAHLVMPATRDGGIIDTFAQALDPDVMPRDGDAAAAALALADQALADAGGGSIVWIADAVAPEQAAALAQWRRGSATPVRLWPPLLAGDERDAVESAAGAVDARVVRLSADDSDVAAVASAAQFAAIQSDSQTQWAESGYWLTPVIAVLLLWFFRRGWLVSLARVA